MPLTMAGIGETNTISRIGGNEETRDVYKRQTYNGGIYPPIENLLAHMKALAVQNRTVAVMDNGTWAATAGTVSYTHLNR